MTRYGTAVDDFLFAPVDARAAAWLRIAFAAAIPFFFRSRHLDVPAWASGFVATVYQNVLLTTGYMLLLTGLCALLAYGWKPRIVGFLLVAVLLPLDFLDVGRQSRQVVLLALLGFVFVPSDAVRFPWTRTAGKEPETAGPAWPIRLIQLLLTILYGANALAKSSPEYLSGSVLMDLSLELPNFRLDLSGGTLELGPLVVPVAIAAAGSAFAEYFLATAFWVRRLKWIAAIGGIAFHVVLTRIVSIFMLDYAAIFLYIVFLLPLISSARSSPDRSSQQPFERRRDLPAPRAA